MLSTLNHVHPLAIDAVVLQNGTDVRWDYFREPLFPHATKLTIDRLDFRVGSEFAAFMRHFPRLTSLSLRDFTIEYTKRDIEAPGPRPALRKLEIYSSTGQEFFMNWFLHQPAENIQLETLVYSVERWELRVPKPSLIALGASVKDITIVFAFESPHYLLKGDPILPYLSSVRSLTFDLATLYGTLYGPPSIPLLLGKLSSAARVSTVRFKFALDSQSTPLTSVVEKLERLRLAQTDALLHALPPFSELQDLLIQVRSNEWVRLKKEPSVEAWFASDKHKWSGEQCFVPLKLTEASGRLEVETLPTSAQSNIHFSHAEFDLANMTWRKVTNVLQGAFPTMAAHKILRVEPLEDESSERERWRPRVYDGYHQEPTAPNVYHHQPRAPIVPYILHFP
ncbi:hypothetical protein FOMPIDRAFT_1130432 [Fomitopsis schrenkii]|uniref:Uncharacterized protein n=1 Tax=Fomitopsis schrenkii TaxID=2126942 RepID=S8DT95_FOMSC|nr:hypothetical protein FOMPIDRAFT_1130432 [Fomitopsis schrenkii]